jgi:hypothetical protein
MHFELIGDITQGVIRKAELHWYEASGIGRKELKLKYLL